MPKPTHEYSTLEYVLLSLVPYTKPNLELSFMPHRFFYELEKTSSKKRATLQRTFSQARQRGYIDMSTGTPLLTEKGHSRIRPYTGTKLQGGVKLMVAFDIPEHQAYKRRQLRTFLRSCQFTQAQKSLWLTENDYRADLKAVVKELQLEDHVDIFECVLIKL